MRRLESAPRVGLRGYGAVGSKVAAALLAMGASVLVFDPFIEESALAGTGIEKVGSLDELFVRSRIVSLHARLTAETAGILSAERIAMMPARSYVVNSARGALVDYEAVTDALRSGHLAGAAFDVFPTEPVDFEHPLFALVEEGANIVLTPHIAGASQDVAHRGARIVAEEMQRWVSGKPLLHRL